MATDQAHLIFKPLQKGKTVGKIESIPDGACSPVYDVGKTRADCMIGATAGATITITPQWG